MLAHIMRNMVVKEDLAPLLTKSDVKVLVAEAVDLFENDMHEIHQDIERIDGNVENISNRLGDTDIFVGEEIAACRRDQYCKIR